MKLQIPSRDRLRINSQHIKFILTLLVIFLFGFLGVLTGFFVFVKPELTATLTTTIPMITTTSTTIATTTIPLISTTNPTTTTIGKEPCSPCFEYFTYLGHNTDSLSIRNGPRTIKITKVSQTKGGTINSDFDMNYVTPNKLMIFLGYFTDGTQINIDYVDITSGNAHLDSATLH
jgi:hypothetical protein